MVELISIHIPKTGGTSFRNVLASIYGEEGVLRVDIALPSEPKPYDENALRPKKLPAGVRVLHGHFRRNDLIDLYKLDPRTLVVAWVREPVARVISNYLYLKKMLRQCLDEKARRVNILNKMERSLLEYARADINRNRMARFLDNVSLDELLFVGVTEHYADDLRALSELLSWGRVPEFLCNTTDAETQDIEEAVIEEVRHLNSRDGELYGEALKLRQQRLRSPILKQSRPEHA